MSELTAGLQGPPGRPGRVSRSLQLEYSLSNSIISILVKKLNTLRYFHYFRAIEANLEKLDQEDLSVRKTILFNTATQTIYNYFPFIRVLF